MSVFCYLFANMLLNYITSNSSSTHWIPSHTHTHTRWDFMWCCIKATRCQYKTNVVLPVKYYRY